MRVSNFSRSRAPVTHLTTAAMSGETLVIEGWVRPEAPALGSWILPGLVIIALVSLIAGMTPFLGFSFSNFSNSFKKTSQILFLIHETVGLLHYLWLLLFNFSAMMCLNVREQGQQYAQMRAHIAEMEKTNGKVSDTEKHYTLPNDISTSAMP